MKKFEPDRVLKEAEAFGASRPDGSLAAALAAERVDRRFHEIGLSDPGTEAVYAGGLGRSVVPALALAFLLLVSIRLTTKTVFPTAPAWGRDLATLALLLTAVVGLRLWELARNPSTKTRVVTGSFPCRQPAPAARIVLVAGLLTPTRGATVVIRWLCLWFAIGSGFVTLGRPASVLIQTSPAVGWALLACQLVATGWFVVLGPNEFTTRPFRGDNRTGIAMLIEFARTWPGSLGDRVETIFVATPDHTRLADWLAARDPEKAGSTLVLILDAPGVGPDLTILGTGPARMFVEQAARDLWLPHGSRGLLLRPGIDAYRRNGLAAVGLCGHRGPSAVDPAVIGRAAQLVVEVAFRWARQAERVQGEGESRARSSQNPG